MHPHNTRWSTAVVLAIVLAMALAGLLAQAPIAKATHDASDWSYYAQLTGSGTEHSYYGNILSDGRGAFYVFYLVRSVALGTTNVWAYKFYDNGMNGYPTLVSGFPVQVNSPSNVVDPNYVPAATIDHTGNLYVAWTRASLGPSVNDVYVSKSSNGGLAWSVAVVANAPNAGEWDYQPSIATLPDGTVYVAWLQYWNGFYNATVSFSTNGGNSFSGYQNITEVPTRFWGLSSVDMRADGQGRLHVVYGRYTAVRALVNYTSFAGVGWTAPVTLNTGTTAGGYVPSLVVDRSDRLHVAWYDARVAPSGNTVVYYRRSDTGGSTWTAQMPISQGKVYANSPHLATEGDTVLVAWDSWNGVRNGLAYAVSADNGDTWYPEVFATFEVDVFASRIGMDRNGTAYVALTRPSSPIQIGLAWWHGPPSRPTITDVARGAASLTVSWTPPPEADLSGYHVWRSADGSTYELVATVDAPTTTYADTGLSNGTYWYKVTAIDLVGYEGHASSPASGVVGLTTQEMVDQLEAQIAGLEAEVTSLQTALANAQADLDSMQAQLTSLQNALTALQTDLNQLQSDTTANQQALTTALNNLKSQLDSLQTQLNAVRTEQATQTMSYVNLGFEVIVVALLALILVMQMRKPKQPKMMMAQNPTQAPQKFEEEL